MNTASRISRIPQELIDIIVHENDTDSATLRSCALVCRAFLPSAQASIFSEIELIPKGSRAELLYEILVDSPHLRRHVRTLRISDAGIDDWTSWCPSFVAVLKLLDAVTSFALADDARKPGDHWGNLPSELRTAICGLCRRSRLVSLRLAHLGTFKDVAEFSELVTSAALTNLVLQDIVLPSLTADDLERLNKQLQLTDCRFDVKSPTLEVIAAWLVGGESLSDLRSLHCPWNLETVSHVRNITQASMSSLQDLFLYSHDLNVSHDFPTTLSLASLVELRMLTASFVIEASHSESFAHGLAGLLVTAPRKLSSFGVGAYLISDPEIPSIDWTPLADTLIKSDTHFPVLRSVGVGVMSLFPASGDSAQRFIEDIRRGLPRLHAQGILKCAIIPPTVLVSRAEL
ncbi:hypothetical protein B0H13DRAFT_2111576 [Mycena leptocephala]|nr:hypothetical protein B0H13DRAFT_2111576 [Mycena leptocephala]